MREADCRPRPPPHPGDGGAWTYGHCWWWCGHRYTLVLWLGTVSSAGQHAPVYACRTCLAQLHHAVLDYSEALLDAPCDIFGGLRVPLYVDANAGSPPPSPVRHRPTPHRLPRSTLGRLWHHLTAGRIRPAP
ncbi:hypothetical protein N0X72_25230 [Streptomyces carpaticus]|uniref:hypothetical protein n=1 Tax=Streptomyces carpaticus TaxID=285558 RepID=UPI002207D914|nr:hypothetical protein N0X72_25230 [Streptomyces carpaticus]